MEAYNRSRKKVSKFAKPKNGDKSTIRRRRAARHSERRNAEASRSDESNSSGSTRGFFARFRRNRASPTEDRPTKKTVFSPIKNFANKKISALKARFASRMPTIATLFAGLLKPKSSTGTPATLTPEPQIVDDEEDEYQQDNRQQLPRPPSGGLLSAVRSWECCSCGGTTGYNNYFCPECGKKRCGSCSTTHEPYV